MASEPENVPFQIIAGTSRLYMPQKLSLIVCTF